MNRTGTARWYGGIKDGKGTLTTESNTLSNTPYSFSARFKDGSGTNPEELIAAAHAGCFTMDLSGRLGAANMVADEIDTTATLTMDKTTRVLPLRKSIWMLKRKFLEGMSTNSRLLWEGQRKDARCQDC